MMGARNGRMLKIALVVGTILLVLYGLSTWRSTTQAQTDRLAAARQEYQELRKNFNKLTDELKQSVQRTAVLRNDLEIQTKTHLTNAAKKDEQIKECVKRSREVQVAQQNAEEERDSYEDENHRLKREKESATAEIERISQELINLKLTSVEQGKDRQKCKSDLESVKTQLMTAQTEGFRLSQKIQDCQTQLTTAQDAFGASEAHNRNHQSEIDQLHLQVQLLQQQNTDLTNKQHVGLTENRIKQGGQQALPDSPSVSDEQRQIVLAGLKEKLTKGDDLTEQEKYALQMLTRNTAKGGFGQLPKKQFHPRDLQDGDQLHTQRKQVFDNEPALVKDPISIKEKKGQQLPPPQPRMGMAQATDEPDPTKTERIPDHEEVRDLVVNREHQQEDGELNHLREEPVDEGGARGDDKLPDDYKEEEEEDDEDEDEKIPDENEDKDDPLPNPVKNEQEEGDEDYDSEKRNGDNGNDLHEDAEKQFQKDFEQERNRMKRVKQRAEV